MRILITGAAGFVGSHLLAALGRQGDVELVGVYRPDSRPVEPAAGIHWEALDLCDGARLEGLLREVQPAQVYHLAGYSDAGRSFQEAEAAWTGNLTATRGLYDAILRWGGKPRVLYVSTGAVYGEPVDPQRPVDELTELRPNSPYAASKAAADLTSYQYARSYGLDIVRARPFNHIGPGQSPRFAVAHFARQIVAIERGLQPPLLRVGNLWTERDITDVRDVVRAYLLLMERGQSGEVYNIGCGHTLSMRTCLDHLLARSRATVRVETDPALVRKVETATLRVSAEALRKATGWRPVYPLEQTLAETLDYYRQVVAQEQAAATGLTAAAAGAVG